MSQNPWSRARALAGVILKDWRRFERAFSADEALYLALCNRGELLEAGPGQRGYRCDWQWTSDLHAPKVLGRLGKRLMRRAFADHPIRRAAAPHGPDAPEVSFIIGHRGQARLPHLLATIESIAGQRDAGVECIVVEQDGGTSAATSLPSWVRHLPSPPPSPEMPFSRSWAFNVGAKSARGHVLVLHDNDILVPADYAANVLAHVAAGFDVVNLKRFLFYLDPEATREVIVSLARLGERPPLAVMQNSQGGGSVAITRAGYQAIGGMDETFIGWGGEDNEFWDRAQTLSVWPYGYLPFVHLWHPDSPGKYQPDNPTLEHYRQLALVPAAQRIAALRQLDQGEACGPRAWLRSNA